MQKYFIVLVVVFAWKVYAQTTDTVADVSGGEELQTEIASTAIPPTSEPETTSVVAEPEETETDLITNSESGTEVEESATEPEQSTELSSEEATIQQENQNTEPGIETEDATSEGASQQEPEAEERTTSSQPPSEDPLPQEGTTPQPALQEAVTPQTTTQEEGSPESTTQATSVVLETTTMQSQIETERAPEQGYADAGSSVNEEVTTETISSQPSTVVDLSTTTTTTTPSTVEQRSTEESSVDTNTEPVRSAIEGDSATAMIETEDTSTDPTTGEGVNQPEGPVDGTINNNESSCPTDCKAGTGDPICGSDQRVYESECHLKRDMCGKNVTAASWELCRGKHDICPAQCLNIQDPVCGEDGKIYPNLCLMYKFNCGKRMRTYDLVRCVNTYRGFRRIDGACPKVCHDLYRPVCGSDGKVYSNDCYMRLQTCGRNVQIVEMSKCVDTPRCPHTCTPLYDPVCGSDGRMYLNHCYFANLNCGKTVAKVDLRYCESFQHLK